MNIKLKGILKYRNVTLFEIVFQEITSSPFYIQVCCVSFYSCSTLHLAHLEDRVKICILLVSADFIEGQEGENPTCLLPRAPLLHQLLRTKT